MCAVSFLKYSGKLLTCPHMEAIILVAHPCRGACLKRWQILFCWRPDCHQIQLKKPYSIICKISFRLDIQNWFTPQGIWSFLLLNLQKTLPFSCKTNQTENQCHSPHCICMFLQNWDILKNVRYFQTLANSTFHFLTLWQQVGTQLC